MTVERCTGCGTAASVEALRAEFPGSISCCPERNMQPGGDGSWAAEFAWANFCKMVFYGRADWPSYSYWIVPGTITDMDRV